MLWPNGAKNKLSLVHEKNWILFRWLSVNCVNLSCIKINRKKRTTLPQQTNAKLRLYALFQCCWNKWNKSNVITGTYCICVIAYILCLIQTEKRLSNSNINSLCYRSKNWKKTIFFTFNRCAKYVFVVRKWWQYS